MNGHIAIFSGNSVERMRLESAVALLNSEAYPKKRYKVAETYFDYGQKWEWTTILCKEDGREFTFYASEYQALSPRQQETIVYGDLDEFIATVKEVLNDE